jgi:hypothetical protein
MGVSRLPFIFIFGKLQDGSISLISISYIYVNIATDPKLATNAKLLCIVGNPGYNVAKNNRSINQPPALQLTPPQVP